MYVTLENDQRRMGIDLLVSKKQSVFCKNETGQVDVVGIDQGNGFKDFGMYGVLAKENENGFEGFRWQDKLMTYGLLWR